MTRLYVPDPLSNNDPFHTALPHPFTTLSLAITFVISDLGSLSKLFLFSRCSYIKTIRSSSAILLRIFSEHLEWQSSDVLIIEKTLFCKSLQINKKLKLTRFRACKPTNELWYQVCSDCRAKCFFTNSMQKGKSFTYRYLNGYGLCCMSN